MAASASAADGAEPASAALAAAAPPGSSKPASASSVSAETLRALDRSLRTRTDGWCSPRSIWLRYGLDRRVRSASWRSDMLASLRLLRMKEPRVSASPSLGSAIVAPAPHLVIGSGHRRPGVVAGDH